MADVYQYADPNGKLLTSSDPNNLPGADPHSGVMKVPAPAPTPTDTPPASSLVDRYAPQRQALSDTYGIIDKPDAGAIREQYRQNAQSAVDAINTKFASIEAADRATIDQTNRERNASNVMNGLSGSSVGAARTEKTGEDNAALQKRTADQKGAEIAAVLSNAETRSTDEFLKERDSYVSQQKDKLTAEQALNSKIADTAKGELSTLAGHMSYDEFAQQKPQLVQQYMKELGTDENGLKAAFLQANEGSLLSKTPTIVGNQAIWFTQKADGTVGQTTMQLPDNKKIQTAHFNKDGTVSVLYADGTYKNVGGGSGGGSPAPSPATTFTKTQMNKGAANAGMNIDEFKKLDPDSQNYFLNGMTKFNSLVKQRDAGTITDEQLADAISKSSAPDAVKTHLYTKAGVSASTGGSGSSSDGPTWWDQAQGIFSNVRSAIGF